MADRWTRNATAKQFGRTSDVEVTKDDKEKVMKLALAHAASGNDYMFQLLWTTLSKTSTEQELRADIAVIKSILATKGK